jgi:Transmembrane secretion effector
LLNSWQRHTDSYEFLKDMLDKKEDLANAIALNSSMVNSARLLGPALAGILVGLLRTFQRILLASACWTMECGKRT